METLSNKLVVSFEDLMRIQKMLVNSNIYRFKMEVIFVTPVNANISTIKGLYSGFDYFIIVKGGALLVFFSPLQLAKLKYMFYNSISIRTTEVDKFYVLQCLQTVDKNSIVFDKKVVKIYLSTSSGI